MKVTNTMVTTLLIIILYKHLHSTRLSSYQFLSTWLAQFQYLNFNPDLISALLVADTTIMSHMFNLTVQSVQDMSDRNKLKSSLHDIYFLYVLYIHGNQWLPWLLTMVTTQQNVCYLSININHWKTEGRQGINFLLH